MITYDTHVHSEYSTDSDTPVEQQIETAVERNLSGLCLTDHMDYEFPKDQPVGGHSLSGIPFVFDLQEYREKLESLRPSYPQIEILTGVECGLQLLPEVIEKNHALAGEKGMDQIIGSLHLVDRKDPYYPEFWAGRNPAECVRQYFEQLYSNLTAFHAIDTLGHLDYIVRYAPETYSYHPEEFRDIIEEILRFLIQKDIALEVNASGWKSMDFPNPHPDILTWYLGMGGELITVGSDAHKPEHLAYSFVRLSDLLQKKGVTQYTIFRRHTPVSLPL